MIQLTQQHAEAVRLDLTPQVIQFEVRRHAMRNFNYLVVDPMSFDAVIVDPAWEMDKIDRAVADAHARLRGILITHSHADHLHLARPLAAKYDCPIYMSKAEIAASGFDVPQLVGIDEIPWLVGQMLIEPILTPGHTPGSTCYLIGDNLFTGDVLFAEGCGMCPDTEAAYEMFASLAYLKTRLEPQTRVYAGHSYGHPPGRAMSHLLRENPFLQFSDKESFAAFRLRGERGPANLIRIR